MTPTGGKVPYPPPVRARRVLRQPTRAPVPLERPKPYGRHPQPLIRRRCRATRREREGWT